MDFSTISNKTGCTEIEEFTNDELSEKYYTLKKQHDNLTLSYEATKQELHDTKRSYQTALDVQSHLTAELESHQADEEKRRSELQSRISALQEDISALREEKAETVECHNNEINRLQNELKRLKEETATQVCEQPAQLDTSELEETRAALGAALTESATNKEALELVKSENNAWQIQAEGLKMEIQQLREAAEARREELRAVNDREATALAELAEAKAMLHQYTSAEDLQPHAAKGNSLFAEVEDKRQEMAKTLIQMKQTNSKLRRDVANKQAEVDALLHEKQTIWEQQLGAAAHYDRELIESYEERISQLEALTERQRRELCKWFAQHCDPTANGWLAGVLEHLKSECEKLRAEVLSRGAAQLATAAQVRELRRKMATVMSNKTVTKESPAERNINVMRDITNRNSSEKSENLSLDEILPKLQSQTKFVAKSVDDVKKRVTFN